jgi:hypothetical protein
MGMPHTQWYCPPEVGALLMISPRVAKWFSHDTYMETSSESTMNVEIVPSHTTKYP